MEGGTRQRHSNRRSSGRQEMVVEESAMVVGEKAEGCWGLGKQDFISHEKCREEHDAADMYAALTLKQ